MSADPYCPAQLFDIAQFPQSFHDKGFVFRPDHLLGLTRSVRVVPWVGWLGRRFGDSGIRRGFFLGFLIHNYTRPILLR